MTHFFLDTQCKSRIHIEHEGVKCLLQLYASFDLGRTWAMVYAMVNPRFFWAVTGHDGSTSTVHLEAEDTATGMRMSVDGFLSK